MRLLFLPTRFQRVGFLVWLKRVHAWTGLWGAALFLLLGTSGFLLNHRAVWKIDTGAPTELSEIAISVASGEIRDEHALAVWAKRQLNTSAEPKPMTEPAGPGQSTGRFLGQERHTVPIWRLAFNHPNGRVVATYLPGGGAVLVKRETNGVLGFLKNLHKGTGLGTAWILLLDTVAGALIAMCLTGFLLWSRLHGPRLLAGTLVSATTLWATAAIWPSLLTTP